MSINLPPPIPPSNCCAYFPIDFYQDSTDAAEECAICLENITDENPEFVKGHVVNEKNPNSKNMPHIHAFHEACIDGWLQTRGQKSYLKWYGGKLDCPSCRTPFTQVFANPEETIPIHKQFPNLKKKQVLDLVLNTTAAVGVFGATFIGLLTIINTLALSSMATMALSFAAFMVSLGAGYITSKVADKLFENVIPKV